MPAAEFILVDISNSFTKVAFSSRGRVGRALRLPTARLTAASLRKLIGSRRVRHAVAASVVPEKNKILNLVLPHPICWVDHKATLGIGINYPNPAAIGADRLANAVAARALYGAPSVVVDFGTAVTFDVISAKGEYIGGVITPGLSAMTDYLHSRTALLPRVTLREPRRAIGRSTKEAMQSGAVHGYRGLISEIVRQILREMNAKKMPPIIATGGDARLIAGKTGIFSAVDPGLTLEGLRLIGGLNFPVQEKTRPAGPKAR
ncbi:MAG: type III pantothenate kinase [Terrimicrobiaceae bacterium]